MHLVKLIGQPVFDWNVFLDIAYQATGERLAEEADTSPREFTNCERIVSCLHKLATSQTRYVAEKYLLSHVSLTFLIVVDVDDVDRVISEMGDMAVLVRATQSRAMVLVVTGTAAQWQSFSHVGPMWDDIRAELKAGQKWIR